MRRIAEQQPSGKLQLDCGWRSWSAQIARTRAFGATQIWSRRLSKSAALIRLLGSSLRDCASEAAVRPDPHLALRRRQDVL